MSRSRAQLKALSRLRRKEAQLLFDAGLYDGAAYLAGYAVELALKARICRILDLAEYPDAGELRRVYATHDLKQLLRLAGLERKLAARDSSFINSWAHMAQWNPERRYDAQGTATESDLRGILNIVDEVRKWIMKYW